MAAKTPTTRYTYPIGGIVNLTVATFADIDDNDTWTSGIEGIIGTPWFGSSVDGSDLAIDDITLGVMTFGSSANNAGTVYTLHKYK